MTGVLVFVVAPHALGGTIVWHDPYLNWDLTNWTGGNINDLEVIVDNPNGKFNPNVNNPAELWAVPFQTITLTTGDFDGDGDQDTKVSYSNPIAVIPHGQTAHGGIYMFGSGVVDDAYWTWNGNKVGSSIPVTYEVTEIRGDPEVHMHLQINKGFFEDAGIEAGWTEIRTFVNLPADLLDLEDLNTSLDLSTLAAYEVTPQYGQPGLPGNTGIPIALTDENLQNVPDSFFDVYLDVIPPENASPAYESLLVATVIGTGGTSDPPEGNGENENVIYGQFWNLNPQSPEPGTLSLLVLGGLALIRRRRK